MKVFQVLFMVLASQLSFGQISDTVAGAIKVLISTQVVANKVFFEYREGGIKPYALPPGKYCFIAPDTTFQKYYKGILGEFPWSLKTDGYFSKRRFYADSLGTVYISGVDRFELVIVFEKIFVTTKEAILVFHTTSSFQQERFKNRYIRVVGNLRKVNSKWEVRKLKVKSINCCLGY